MHEKLSANLSVHLEFFFMHNIRRVITWLGLEPRM
jgi:hypothetical protein